jgi:hypothetical protein
MTTAAARNEQEHTPEATLFVAFELSERRGGSRSTNTHVCGATGGIKSRAGRA